MSVDKYFHRTYDKDKYNCLHLTCEAWFDETGEDLTERLHGLLGSRGERRVRLAHFRAFERLDKPVSPCVVLMERPGPFEPHVGIYLRGSVLHIRENGAVEFLPVELAARNFTSVRFYK